MELILLVAGVFLASGVIGFGAARLLRNRSPLVRDYAIEEPIPDPDCPAFRRRQVIDAARAAFANDPADFDFRRKRS